MTIFEFSADLSNAPKYRTVHALLIHILHGRVGTSNTSVVTAHRVFEGERCSQIGAGRLLSPNEQQTLVSALDCDTQPDTFFIDPELLWHGRRCLGWVAMRRRRLMWYRSGTRTERWCVPWPSIVMNVVGRSLFVGALNNDERPRLDTPVFHAPLMNVSSRGSLCAGTASMPLGCTQADRPAYENILYDTAFSHVTHANTLTLPERLEVDTVAHARFWRSLHRARADTFPIEALVPMNLTLSQWMNQTGALT